MNKSLISHYFTLISLCISFFSGTISASSSGPTGGSVGINYGRIADNLPPPEKVVQLLRAKGITRVKIFDTDPTVLSAFARTNISLTVALPNEHLSAAASSQSYTDTWLRANIIPHHPSTTIEAIAVGNEVFVNPNNTTRHLMSAMENVQASLAKYDLAPEIKVSSPIALSCLQNSYPPSSGSFRPDLAEPVVRPMLDLIRRTGSYLMVNAYPFFAYVDNSDKISLDYALLRDNATGNADSGNGLMYRSLFEAQVDAVYSAMSRLGFGDVRVVVSETGWPSKGDERETGAGPQNAAAYNGNLVRRALTRPGTPLRPDRPLEVFLFALFNENSKPGPTSERNYGLFYPSEESVYDIPLTVEDLAAAAANQSRVVEEEEDEEEVVGPQTWCVANGGVGTERLQRALDYACGSGGADCGPIKKGAVCFEPDTVVAHASYAFNSYYQKNERGHGTCDFAGAAYVVTQPPKFGSCVYPTGY